MFNKNQNGSILSVVVIVLLAAGLFASLVFGFMAYSKGKDYKDNYDAKAAVAVSAALAGQKDKLDKEYLEQSKSPVKAYLGPVTYGNIYFDYPRNWSAYVEESSSSQQPINGYFHPEVVPGVGSKKTYALRAELVNQQYANVIQQYASKVKTGDLTASAFIPEQLVDNQSVQPGTRYDGLIEKDINGAVVIIQVRDKTLKVYTESLDFVSDFNNIVLPSLRFAP